MDGILGYFLDSYRQYGPVFRMPPDQKGTLVLAGPEANLLLAHYGSQYFTSEQVFGEFGRELGADNFIVAVDGPPHRNLRNTMRPAFSPAAIARYIPVMLGVVHKAAMRWQKGDQLEMVETFRRLVADQTTLAMTGQTTGSSYEYVSYFLQTVLETLVSRTAPRSALSTFDYAVAKAKVFQRIRKIVADHRQNGSRAVSDFIDLLLAGCDQDGNPMAENDVIAAALVPFFAGLDTVASTCGNMFYALLNRSDLMNRIISEVEEAFSRDDPTTESLKELKCLYGSVMETLRLYPVAPSATRYVVQTFYFEGHTIHAGQVILIATPLTNFLSEFFPDPFKFDPARFFEPRNEHTKPGAFAPFLKGPHQCLGAALAEVEVMLCVGALLYSASFELLLPTETGTRVDGPIPQHNGAYHVRITGVRGNGV
jgi:cytochrome P450